MWIYKTIGYAGIEMAQNIIISRDLEPLVIPLCWFSGGLMGWLEEWGEASNWVSVSLHSHLTLSLFPHPNTTLSLSPHAYISLTPSLPLYPCSLPTFTSLPTRTTHHIHYLYTISTHLTASLSLHTTPHHPPSPPPSPGIMKQSRRRWLWWWSRPHILALLPPALAPGHTLDTVGSSPLKTASRWSGCIWREWRNLFY